MAITVKVNSECVYRLDIEPASRAIAELLAKGALAACEEQLCFDIDLATEPTDPRELSEIPELRLWFIRLDTRYPWLPVLLISQPQEFTRYAAMLVPHQFHRTEGIQYNPEALEIFLMGKIFTIADWLEQQGLPSKSKLKSMALLLGYELDDAFFDQLTNRD